MPVVSSLVIIVSWTYSRGRIRLPSDHRIKKLRVIRARIKPNFLDSRLEFGKSSKWSLFQPIQRLVDPANFVRRISVSKRWLDIAFFTRITIEKCIFHIYLKRIPMRHEGNDKEWLNKGKSSRRCKYLDAAWLGGLQRRTTIKQRITNSRS